MKQVNIEVVLKIQGREDYETVTIMQREIKGTVPPGVDPADYLVHVCQEEVNKMRHAFEQFPQYAALPSPVTE